MIEPLSLLALPLSVQRDNQIVTADNERIAIVNPHRFGVGDDDMDTVAAFSAILAAAPDMLLALEAVAAVDDALGLNGTATGPMMAKVYAAIAKARGVKS